MPDTNDWLEGLWAGKIELESVVELHIRKLLRRFLQAVHHLLLGHHLLSPDRKPDKESWTSRVNLGPKSEDSTINANKVLP